MPCDVSAKSWWSTERCGQKQTPWTRCGPPTALVVSGNHPEKIGRFMQYANIGTVSKSAFHRLSSHIIQPLVKDTFEAVLDENRKASPDGQLVLSGRYCQVWAPDQLLSCYTPKEVIQGSLDQHRSPLQARDGEVPKVAQIHVHDPQCAYRQNRGRGRHWLCMRQVCWVDSYYEILK